MTRKVKDQARAYFYGYSYRDGDRLVGDEYPVDGKEGVCPACGGPVTGDGKFDGCDDELSRPFRCGSCGLSGLEWRKVYGGKE